MSFVCSTVRIGYLRLFERSVIVTVVTVRMMQVTIHKIIDVVAMGNGFVSTAGTVDVIGVVTVARVLRRAVCGVLGVHVERVTFDAVVSRMMQVTIVEVVDVVVVLDGLVTAIRTVFVIMARMCWLSHFFLSFPF